MAFTFFPFLFSSMKVVICGGGIIGTSTAFHLAARGVSSTIVERSSPACAASGKAGGFLAREWCDHFEVGALARSSFDLHMTLAADPRFKDCDYRYGFL
jgi:glycine/D-amino acid oxidase-like deaminating enzyme